MKRAKKNRLLAFLLTVALLVAMLPTVAFAKDSGSSSATKSSLSGNCGAEDGQSSVTWKLEQNNEDDENPTYTLTISGSGEMADFTSSTGMPWSNMKSEITSVIIGSGVTNIGNYAFQGCANLTSVSMADSVTSIGNAAFNSCEKLTELTIGKGVTTINAWAFNNMYGLEKFSVADGNETFIVDDYGVLYAKVSVSDGTTLKLQSSSKASTGAYTVPDSIGGMMVTAIETAAFAHSSWSSVVISDNVKEIGTYVFVSNMSLASVTLSNQITSIGTATFSGDTSLSAITFPESVTNIGDGAFSGCTSLTEIDTNKVTSIAGQAFSNCSGLERVAIGSNVTIGNSAFEKCTSLKKLTLGESCIIGQSFKNCTSLTSIVIPEKTTVGYYAFQNCTNLTDVTFGGLVAPGANFPSSNTDSLIKLDQYAFAGCTSLVKAKFDKGTQNAGKQTSTNTTFENYLILCIQKDNAATWYKADGTLYTRWNYNCSSDPCELSNGDVIYAVYTSAISFEANGGTGTVSNVDSYYAPGLDDGATLTIAGKNCTLPGEGFSRDGYEFAGWNTKADGTGTAFSADEPVPISNQQITKLYAQWTMKMGENSSYTVNAIMDQIYTGAEIKPTVVVKNSTTGDVIASDGYTVTYSENINVGTASVTVKKGDESATLNFIIKQDGNPSVSIADKSVTYGDTYTMTAAAKTSAGNEITNGTITIKYYTDADCTMEWMGADGEEQPTAAGTYYAKAVLAETDNYAEAASAIAKLTISNATFSVTAEGYSGIYDGQAHSITVTADGVDVTYSTDGKTYSGQNPTFTDAGEYTVYYKAAKANYEDATGSVTVKISKANQVISYSAKVEKHINDKAFTNELAQTTVKGKVTYASDNTEVATVNAETGEVTIVGAGTATITAAVAGTDNYNEATATYTLTVSDHSYGAEWESDSTNHWHECTICGDKSDTAAHTFTWVTDKEATAAEKGSKHEECSVCGYKKAAVEIPATGNTNTETGNTNKGNANTGTGTSIGSSTNTGSNISTGNNTSRSTTSPRTGDNSNLVFWIVLLLLASGGMIGVAVYTRKRRNN